MTHRVGEEKYKIEKDVKNHAEGMELVIEQLLHKDYGVISSLDEIDAIGHRIVHGGEKFTKSVLNDEVVKGIEDAIQFAPLHNPAHLQGIYACKKITWKAKCCVFDTAFHQTIPEKAYMYAIPYEYYEKYKFVNMVHMVHHINLFTKGSRNYGKPIEDLKIISCHLGQGASLCAVKDGKSVDTSMGLTPLAGVPMGSRSGDIDPSVLLFNGKRKFLQKK